MSRRAFPGPGESLLSSRLHLLGAVSALRAVLLQGPQRLAPSDQRGTSCQRWTPNPPALSLVRRFRTKPPARPPPQAAASAACLRCIAPDPLTRPADPSRRRVCRQRETVSLTAQSHVS